MLAKTTMVSDHALLIYASVHMKFIVSTYTTQGYITQWCVELPPIIEVALAMIFSSFEAYQLFHYTLYIKFREKVSSHENSN